MGLSGLEPPTSRLSGVRSNRLSYKPLSFRAGYSLFLILFSNSGGHLLSRVPAVSSASRGLTLVFGMGTGVPPGRIATGILFRCPLATGQQYDPYFFP